MFFRLYMYVIPSKSYSNLKLIPQFNEINYQGNSKIGAVIKVSVFGLFQGSTVEKYLLEDLGALLICMEYQQAANRMKVMVRKGRDFPKSDKLIGRPGTIWFVRGLIQK